MKGASVKVAILNFFTRQDLFVHHAKFHFLLRPPSTFLGPKTQTLPYSGSDACTH